MDQYNYGNPLESKRTHYPIITCGYIKDATRFTVSYGRQRAGLFCVGGVCPFVTGIIAKNGKIDDKTIKQLMTMQEDAR